MNRKSEALFQRALKKHRKMVKRLEDNLKVYRQFLNLDEEKVNDYLSKLEKYNVEFTALSDRLEEFQEKFRGVGGNARVFDHVVDSCFIDINLVKDIIKHCSK